MICTFFGHRDAPQQLTLLLKTTIENLIVRQNLSLFYVGRQGNFDAMAARSLSELSERYAICYYVVLPYLPRQNDPLATEDHTIFPEGFELFPPRYAIDRANRWMLDKSDYVVTYVSHPTGGAAHYKELAERKGKTVIELAEHQPL